MDTVSRDGAEPYALINLYVSAVRTTAELATFEPTSRPAVTMRGQAMLLGARLGIPADDVLHACRPLVLPFLARPATWRQRAANAVLWAWYQRRLRTVFDTLALDTKPLSDFIRKDEK